MKVEFNVRVTCSNCGKELEASYHKWLGDDDIINVKPCTCKSQAVDEYKLGWVEALRSVDGLTEEQALEHFNECAPLNKLSPIQEFKVIEIVGTLDPNIEVEVKGMLKKPG